MPLSDPDLAFPAMPEVPRSEFRRWMMLNLWVAHWAMLWDTGTMDRLRLGHLFEELFRDPTAAQWWLSVGARDWADVSTKRRLAFHELAQSAYRQAVEARQAETGRRGGEAAPRQD
ncbi:hypothetical protein Ade02nite_83080 [Paractinoplanes deccanensis]|uniref:Uncharacterized protein n=1 Tax=Paractinoplanes deccanensis TaxID=113561 RepID=A0ABQ3YI74_9ACTN|nr:DUF6082 family protein [Actinoplanes deccanensis]GID79667.1 hypothetical protein Ade02nite_83080 [Actinoplanes deccanensis]